MADLSDALREHLYVAVIATAAAAHTSSANQSHNCGSNCPETLSDGFEGGVDCTFLFDHGDLAVTITHNQPPGTFHELHERLKASGWCATSYTKDILDTDGTIICREDTFVIQLEVDAGTVSTVR